MSKQMKQSHKGALIVGGVVAAGLLVAGLVAASRSAAAATPTVNPPPAPAPAPAPAPGTVPVGLSATVTLVPGQMVPVTVSRQGGTLTMQVAGSNGYIQAFTSSNQAVLPTNVNSSNWTLPVVTMPVVNAGFTNIGVTWTDPAGNTQSSQFVVNVA